MALPNTLAKYHKKVSLADKNIHSPINPMIPAPRNQMETPLTCSFLANMDT